MSIVTKPMARRATKENYVNNKEFLDALMVYRQQVAVAIESDKTKPRIPNYIGECFLKIATHLSYKPNFVNYMFREDMISDGIENCVQYIDRFNPEKSTNPFAYFTQIIYFAFLRRIQREKKQLEIKNKILERSGYDEVLHMDSHSGDMIGYNNSSDMNSIKENLEMRSKR
jgi:hypothetical protein